MANLQTIIGGDLLMSVIGTVAATTGIFCAAAYQYYIPRQLRDIREQFDGANSRLGEDLASFIGTTDARLSTLERGASLIPTNVANFDVNEIYATIKDPIRMKEYTNRIGAFLAEPSGRDAVFKILWTTKVAINLWPILLMLYWTLPYWSWTIITPFKYVWNLVRFCVVGLWFLLLDYVVEPARGTVRDPRQFVTIQLWRFIGLWSVLWLGSTDGIHSFLGHWHRMTNAFGVFATKPEEATEEEKMDVSKEDTIPKSK